MQPTAVQGQTLNSLRPVLSSVGRRGPEAPFALSAEPGDRHRGLSSLLKHQQWDQPSLLRLHRGALSSSPSACEQVNGLKGSFHRIITHPFA